MYKQPSSKYFNKIKHENNFCVYGKPQNTNLSNPLVLFSEVDGTALASLHFKLSDRHDAKNDIDAKTVLAPLLSHDANPLIQRFQGLINKENQEFEYVITNLCSDGYINFNLMNTNENVTETNPGGINEINELRPFESCAIKCDQINNMPMILQKYKDQDGKTMTVETDEIEQNESKKLSKGVNIFLNVAPQDQCKEMLALFEHTTWKVAELIPIKCLKSSNNLRVQYGGSSDSDSSIDHMYPPYNDPYGHYEDSYESGNIVSYDNEEIYSFANSPSISLNSPQSVSLNSVDSISLVAKVESRSMSTSTHESKFESFKTKILNTINKKKNKKESYFEDEYESISTRNNCLVQEVDTQDINKQIMESELGKVTYGDTKIEVFGHQTDIMYDYTKTSKPCVLGLSINEKLGFVLMNEEQELLIRQEMINDAGEIIKNLINKKFDEFLKGKIYEADECVICLTEGCNCVLFECGHKCGHYECLHTLIKCPVCRSMISARINVSSTV